MAKAKKRPKRSLKTFVNSRLFPALVIAIVILGVAIGFVINNALKPPKDYTYIPGQNYYSKNLKLSAVFPKGWYIDDKNTNCSADCSIIASSTKGSSLKSGVINILKTYSVSYSLSALAKTEFNLIVSDKTDPAIDVSYGDTTISGLPAKTISFISKTFGHEQEVITKDNTTGYSFIFVLYGPDNKWALLENEWQTLLHTVSIAHY